MYSNEYKFKINLTIKNELICSGISIEKKNRRRNCKHQPQSLLLFTIKITDVYHKNYRCSAAATSSNSSCKVF